MKKMIFKLLLLSCVVFLAAQSKSEAMGLFYTNSSYPITATGQEIEDFSTLKKGSASSTNILFLVEIGDAGTDKAAKDGGIKKISYIDVNEKSVFIFWRKITVTVYGE